MLQPVPGQSPCSLGKSQRESHSGSSYTSLVAESFLASVGTLLIRRQGVKGRRLGAHCRTPCTHANLMWGPGPAGTKMKLLR